MLETDPVLAEYIGETRLSYDKMLSAHVELSKSQSSYLRIKANKESLFSRLKRGAPADLKSETARESYAYASKDWEAFALGLAEAEARFEADRRAYQLSYYEHQIAMKAYDAAHLTFKSEIPAIRRES